MLKKTSSQLATQSESLHHDISPQPFPTKVHPPMQTIFYKMDRPLTILTRLLLDLKNYPQQILPENLVLPTCLSPDPRHLIPITMGDMADAVCMADGFEKNQKLPDPVPGCPSFRKLGSDFDVMVKTFVGTAIDTTVIVNDQVGLYRATAGCVVACLFKEFQISAAFESLIETVSGINASLQKTDKNVMDPEEQVQDPEEDTPFRGKFEVVQKLLTNLNNGVGSKDNAEEIIDLNGTPEAGDTGIKQLKKYTAESKLSYGIMDGAARAFLETNIMDNFQTSFYVIVFAGYISEHAACARKAIESQKYLHCQRPKVSNKKCL